MKFKNKIANFPIILFFMLSLVVTNKSLAQYNNKWMTAGAFQDFFSEIGDEPEESFVKQQQYGGQWPAIHPNQDSKAARGLWIGVTNFKDATGSYPFKVVHVGPRVSGAGEFFPVTFKLISKFDPPQVYVDGTPTYNNPTENDVVDPTIPSDRELVTVDNTLLGLTMTRKIYQFSQQLNDNYMIYDYTFTNTGFTSSSSQINLPNNTLTGVYFYFQYRNSMNRESSSEIGNATQWGFNTMNDARGDGAQNIALYNDPPDQQTFRAQYSWHGKYAPFTQYDNIGGPLWFYSSSTTTISKSDTVGRLSAIQFYGVATLHADKSAEDSTDDFNQPSTTNYIGSDDPNESNNDTFNPTRMSTEYNTWMASGHESPRHADKVQPDGKFDVPTGDPSLGTTGGWSFGNGYGPYTIKPGESVHIVMAEAMAGLSREAATRIGIAYKNGLISAKAKNDSVLTGRDSLFQTFNRAIANYKSGYNIPEPPYPPKLFNVNSGGNKISLTWDVYSNDPNLKGFNIYRANGQYDSTYHLIYTAGPNERSYDDLTPIRGLSYYYYITSVGNNGLESSEYYTQTYNPATLKRPADSVMSDIRVVPNPYNISAAKSLGFGDQQANRLAFFNIPGQCTIRIYTEIGELIYTIVHTDGSGDAYWDSVTSSNQLVVSGIYIAVVDNTVTGQRKIVKFVIIR